MRIDAHQHFWQYVEGASDFSWIDDSMKVIRRSFMPEDLAAPLTAARFDGCVAVQAAEAQAENPFLLGLAQRYDFIRAIVGWVDLRAPDVDLELDRLCMHEKFRGVRRIIQAEPASIMQDVDFRRGVRALARRHLTYDLLIYQHQLPEAVRFVRDFDELPIVVDHGAKPLIAKGEREPWARHMRELGRCSNCYCKLSGLVTEAQWADWSSADLRPYLDVMFESFSEDRLMFGSDWPVCLVAASYERVVATIDEYLGSCGSRAGAAIFGENAARFYGLQG